jgi:tRNA1Val (adenine37-N6)-methyltransferase
MMAQRSNAQIDAIEIEPDALKDAKLNFNNSKWNNRLNAFHSSLQDFATTNKSKYDCIVCNPPFFTNGVQSKKQGRSIARHTDSLSFKDLLNGIIKLLNKDGRFSVVLPFDSKVEFIATAQQLNLVCSKIVEVKPKPSKTAKRVLLEFLFHEVKTSYNELTIETEVRHEYTTEFKKLIQSFYLNP